MLSQLQFKVLDPTEERLEKVTHEWLRQATFFIGASWYVNREEFATIQEASEKLRLRWLLHYNITKVVIEQRENRRNWLGGYFISSYDPFVLDCFSGHYRVSDDEISVVEQTVKLYLPNIELVRCYYCHSRFENLRLDDKWCCDSCRRDFATKPDRAGFVYIFGSTDKGYFKIGCGNRPIARMKDYEASKLPFRVEMIHTIPVDDKIKAEAELHRLFRDKRTNGEWFQLDSADLNRVAGLKKYVAGHWIR